VHTFDGTSEDLHELLDLGFHIGINGCSMKGEENLKVVAEIPEDKLLLETDAPWCGIKNSHAGSGFIKTKFETKKVEKYQDGLMVKDRNEPCTMVQVLEVVAAVREADPVALAEKVWQNTEDLFFPDSSNS
jgi:TatD DNase family protein